METKPRAFETFVFSSVSKKYHWVNFGKNLQRITSIYGVYLFCPKTIKYKASLFYLLRRNFRSFELHESRTLNQKSLVRLLCTYSKHVMSQFQQFSYSFFNIRKSSGKFSNIINFELLDLLIWKLNSSCFEMTVSVRIKISMTNNNKYSERHFKNFHFLRIYHILDNNTTNSDSHFCNQSLQSSCCTFIGFIGPTKRCP